MFKPRPLQQLVVDYTSGKMGVAAVPGSGKTHTLSYLAASLIANGFIQEDQEILVVTLVNSAVNNFSGRIKDFIKDYNLMPGVSYRVRTLHGLANDIVRDRPDLAGLPNQFSIIDEEEAKGILVSAVQTWLRAHPEFLINYTDASFDLTDRRIQKDWQETMVKVASAFIRQAKDREMTPGSIRDRLSALHNQYPLLEMGSDIYSDYQRALGYRSAVDFDDLIRLALKALRSDPDFLIRMRYHFPYILEDEAQDSSRLQEKILRELAGETGNWVRVGDPNQAIFETFTTADPKYLIEFLEEPGVVKCSLANSGRSTLSIISLANKLVDWTNHSHPTESLRDALYPNIIEPAPAGDVQPNPPDNPDAIHLGKSKYSSDEELDRVAQSLKRWLKDPQHQTETAVVLVPTNHRGDRTAARLKEYGLEVVERLRNTSSTRQTAKDMAVILEALAEPNAPQKLAQVYRVLRRPKVEKEEPSEIISTISGLIHKCAHLEMFLHPRPDQDWLGQLAQHQSAPQDILDELDWFRSYIQRWQAATILPIDQLILTISQELFTDPIDLALVHKLALVLERLALVNPRWQLFDFALELGKIARNERELSGFSEGDTGFDPDLYRGKIVVSTMHKAKGLEWDRVHLTSVNNFDFPSCLPGDNYMSERYYIKNKLNLMAEALDQLKHLADHDIPGVLLEEGEATLQDRIAYSRERLRLLYVGITRAKKELIITWNTGRNGDCQAALPLVELQANWEKTGYVSAP